MQLSTKGLFRGVMTGAIALGLMGTAAISTPVSAQTGVVCVLNPQLELADQNGDGTVTIAEIDRVIELSGNNADLQAARDEAVAAGVTGIQYTGCTPDDGTTDPGDGTTDPGDGDGTTDPGDGDGTTDPGDGDGTTDPGDGDDNGETPGGETPGSGDGTTGGGDGVSELPDTGSGIAESNTTSWIMMSVGSLMAAAGAFIFRAKKA